MIADLRWPDMPFAEVIDHERSQTDTADLALAVVPRQIAQVICVAELTVWLRARQGVVVKMSSSAIGRAVLRREPVVLVNDADSPAMPPNDDCWCLNAEVYHLWPLRALAAPDTPRVHD